MGERLHYENSTLIGNWYEDRLDTSRAPFPELERTGRYRNTPLKMTRPVPDMYSTTSGSTYTREPIFEPHHQSIKFVSRKTLKNINQSDLLLANANQQTTHDNRPALPASSASAASSPSSTVNHNKSILSTASTGELIPIPTSGFGSVLPRFPSNHDVRYLATTSHSSYGGKYSDDPNAMSEYMAQHERWLSQLDRVHGYRNNATSYFDKATGVRTAGATAERLRCSADQDPKQHTFVQRSWMYNKDHLRYYSMPREKFITTSKDNLPGLMLAGLGAAKPVDDQAAANPKRFHKVSLQHRNSGIWREF